MSVDKFNDSVFSQIMESNDSGLLGWARNVYSKIKRNGILPEYIEREKEDNFINISVDPATYNTYLEDNTNFTFGKCISGQDIPLTSVTNLGTAHTIRFEVSSEAFLAFKIFSDKENGNNYIYVKTDSIVYKCGGDELEFTPVTYSTLSKIVIERDNLSVRCTVNGVEVDQLTLTQNNEFYFDYLIETTIAYTDIRYGLLYNHYVIEGTGDNSIISSSMSTVGWNIPTNTNLTTLITYMGGNLVAGGKLKSTGFTYWDSPNTGATNIVNFDSRGNGIRRYDTGEFGSLKQRDDFWTSTSAGGETYYVGGLMQYDTASRIAAASHKKSGSAIRLVRTATTAEQLLSDGKFCDPFIGIDQKIYRAVKIGTQIWMAENLAETKYRNGIYITEVTSGSSWISLSTGACCAYNNDHNNI